MKLPLCATENRPLTDNPALFPVNWPDHQLHAMSLLENYCALDKIKNIVEVGGSVGVNIRNRFPNLSYHNLDITDGCEGLPTIICDVTKSIPLIDNSVDFIYSNNALEHVTTPWTVAVELMRILRPGGYIYISAPFAWRYQLAPFYISAPCMV
jgi:SAM-dependent methyltransferase